MMLHPDQIASHDRLFFDYSLSFNGPTSYEVQSPQAVRLPAAAMGAVEADLPLILHALERQIRALPVPHFPLRDEILQAEGARMVSPLFSARGDIVLGADGQGYLIEINMDRNGMQRESMADPSGGQRFRQRYLEVLRQYWERYGNAQRPPRVAVLIAPAYREESSLAPFYALMICEGLGWPCVVAGADNLAVTGNQVLAFGQPVDLILRQYPTEYLYELECGAALLTAHQAGRVLILNDPVAIAGQSKAWMAQFWQQTGHGLTAAEQAAVRRLIPFTASVESPSLPLDPADPEGAWAPLRAVLTAHPEAWVLKPVLGRYSWGVVVGASVPRGEWQRALRQALAQPAYWIVQRYIPPQPQPLVRWQKGEQTELTGYVNYGLHVLGGQLAGWTARCSSAPVTDDAWFAAAVPAEQGG